MRLTESRSSVVFLLSCIFLFSIVENGKSNPVANETYSIFVYGDSNTYGRVPKWDPQFPDGRYPDHLRWAGVLQKQLGKSVKVVVDGRVGRASEEHEVISTAEGKGRLDVLPLSIKNAGPYDLIIVMLGTNDVQSGRNNSAEDVAFSVFKLINEFSLQTKSYFDLTAAPKTLVVVPPSLGDTSKGSLHGLFHKGIAASRRFGEVFTDYSKKEIGKGVLLFDAGAVINTDGEDGVHLSLSSHEVLGKALANFLKSSDLL